MLKIQTVPTIAPGGRVILVGDIHGCSEEFDALLQKLKFNRASDTLILVGDLVNKGYDSVGVVERAIQYGAIGVLGNHDASLIARYERIREGEIDPSAPPHTLDAMTQTAAALPKSCYKYLSNLAHILTVPQFDIIVAHAGLNPKLALDQQNIWELLHMRRILPNGRVIDAQSGGDLWATKWKGPQTVIFGHDARTGLQRHPFAIGIDTGCCYGGDLTAYVLPQKELVRIPGSQRGVTKKPPMASPETQIGFSPSTEVTEAAASPTPAPQPAPVTHALPAGGWIPQLAQMVAPPAGSNRQTPTGQPPIAPGANSTATELLKNLLFNNKNPSPAPMSDGPTFPSAPAGHGETSMGASAKPSVAAAVSRPVEQRPGLVAPRSVIAAAASNGTAPVAPVHTDPAAKLVPSATLAKKPVIPTPQPAEVKPPAPSSREPSTNTSPITRLAGPETTSAAATAAAPKEALVRAPAPAATSAAAQGPEWPLVRHVFDVAGQLAAAPGATALAAVTAVHLLCRGPMEDLRQQLLDDPTITDAQWGGLLVGLGRHITDPKVPGYVADEVLLLIQDIADCRPNVLGVIDRQGLAASVSLASAASRSTAKSTLIALRN